MALVCDIKRMDAMESEPPCSPEDHQEDPEAEKEQQQKQSEQPNNEDLEDGEIEDDDEEVPEPEEIPQQIPNTSQANAPQPQQFPPTNNPDMDSRSENKFGEEKFGEMKFGEAKFGEGKFGEGKFGEGKFGENKFGSPNNRFHEKYRDRRRFDRRDARRGVPVGEERGGKHLTEAEKSVMYLHKLERMEREKRERYKREQGNLIDDFASNIEKAIANVLKKEQKDGSIKTSDEEKEEVKRGKKRKKKDKDKKKSKQRRLESPKSEDFDEKELLNIRAGNMDMRPFGSPKELRSPGDSRSPSRSDYEGSESDSSDKSREDKPERKRRRPHHRQRLKNKDRRDRKSNQDMSKEKKGEPQLKDSQNICVFYMQGKCHKGDECPYSHEALPPMKLELCKFYLMDCCAKGDKCLYMHSNFPCKFYHTGLKCYAEDKCKFSHGKPLNDSLKQILFKHIETAPKEILGDFPRLTRDGAINMINQTQKSLEVKYGAERKDGGGDKGIPSLFDINVSMPSELQSDADSNLKDKMDKGANRERKSRWQDPDNNDIGLNMQGQQQKMFRMKGFYTERDQDMRITSNGDVDMRTLPPHVSTPPLQIPPLGSQPIMSFSKMPPNVQTTPAAAATPRDPVSFSQDVDIRGTADIDIRNTTSFFDNRDVDIRQPPPSFAVDVDTRQIDFAKDVDIRQFGSLGVEADDNGDEPGLEIVMDEDAKEQKGMAKADVDSRVLNFDTSRVGMAVQQQSANVNKDIDSRIGGFGSLTTALPPNLPKKQMELFLRIQAQQKDNVPNICGPEPEENDDANVDWYSDDDDDCKLTIKDDVEELKSETPPIQSFMSPPQIKPNEVMEKLGDLSKIDISAEVTKLLSSISQGTLGAKESPKPVPPKDPRLAAQAATTSAVELPKISPADPRRSRLSSTETKPKEAKLSIYEQGSLSLENAKKDVDLMGVGKDTDLRSTLGDLDLRGGTRPDIDLRHLNLPFKAIQNYTPATEVDASINSHPPITWKVITVDIPQPDYTGLKLSEQEAQNSGDPRLRKIFRLSTEEKDSPASPKESPKTTPVRVDPRKRKMEENKSADSTQMTYSQQLSMLQSSAFYQSLTSNQKLLLNKELATKTDGTGSHDPVLGGLLSNLGLLPNTSMPSAVSSVPNSNALNILANINSSSMIPMGQNPNLLGPNHSIPSQNPPMLNQNPSTLAQMPIGQNQPMMGPGPNQNMPGMMGQNPNFVNPNILSQNPNMMPQPGLLGPPPPNLPGEFQLNFDPRQGGLLGNAPIDFPSHNMNFNNDEYYTDGGGFGGGGGGNRNERGYNRDRPQRRGRSFNNRSGGRSFRNRNQNRSNRSRTPP